MDISVMKAGQKASGDGPRPTSPTVTMMPRGLPRVEALTIAAFGSGYAADDSTRGVACSMARARVDNTF